MDNSTNVRGLGQHRVIKIELEKDYEYNDAETYQSFQYQRVYFRRSNDFDRYQTYTENYVVPGFTGFALCCRHGDRPCFLHLGYYFLCTCFMLSHPYRLWMEKLSVKTDVNICKRVSADPMAMQQMPLVMQYEQAGNLAVQTAVVYQELYGVPQPNMPTAVAQAMPVATATAIVPTAYAVPVASAQSFELGDESSKEQREQMFAQLENMQQPKHVTLKAPAEVAPTITAPVETPGATTPNAGPVVVTVAATATAVPSAAAAAMTAPSVGGPSTTVVATAVAVPITQTAL